MSLPPIYALALDGAGHAPRAASASPELAPRDRHDLDAVLAQHGVGRDVAVVAEDHPGSDRQVVGPVVPLLTLGGPDVLVGRQHRDLRDLEDLGQSVPQAVVPRDRQLARFSPAEMVQLRRWRSK